MDTLVLDYNHDKAILSVISSDKSESFEYDISDKEYSEGVVQDFLGVDLNNTYVSSITNIIEGTNARIYTILPPVSKYPLVTISTIKPIPNKEHLFENDPIFRTTLSFRGLLDQGGLEPGVSNGDYNQRFRGLLDQLMLLIF